MAAKAGPDGFVRRKVADLHREGLNGSQIADALGISKQAVSQHLKKIRSEGLTPRGSARDPR